MPRCRYRVALPLALGVWILLIWVQEPAFMRRAGTPFFWESVEAAMSFCFALVPLAWLLARSPSSTLPVLRATRYPLRMISVSACSIIIYGIEVAIWASLLGWTQTITCPGTQCILGIGAVGAGPADRIAPRPSGTAR